MASEKSHANQSNLRTTHCLAYRASKKLHLPRRTEKLAELCFKRKPSRSKPRGVRTDWGLDYANSRRRMTQIQGGGTDLGPFSLRWGGADASSPRSWSERDRQIKSANGHTTL
jgi:hypothetical protein